MRFEMLKTRPTSGMRSISDATKPNTARTAVSPSPSWEEYERGEGRTAVADLSLGDEELDLERPACEDKGASARARSGQRLDETHVIFLAAKY